MAYSVDLRKKVTDFIGEGHTIREAHEIFKVGITTIKEWKKLLAEQGTLEKRPLERGHKKVCPVKLKAYMKENPDSYLRETAEEFGCTEQAIFYALKRLKITRKKNG